jgi:hypothetical protein
VAIGYYKKVVNGGKRRLENHGKSWIRGIGNYWIVTKVRWWDRVDFGINTLENSVNSW